MKEIAKNRISQIEFGGLIDKKPLDENIYVMIIMYYLHSFLGTAIA